MSKNVNHLYDDAQEYGSLFPIKTESENKLKSYAELMYINAIWIGLGHK